MSEHLYIVQASTIPEAGVGCFAMSHVPAGDRLDSSPAKGTVRTLAEEEIPDVYLKYCPRLDSGLYLAPAKFTMMSVFWYINHAKVPNTAVQGNTIYAARDLEPGEEVTMYYPDLLTHPKNLLWVRPEHV
jgi:hypothetical protein